MQPSTASSTVALKAKLFRGLADPSRLSILVALQERPLTVNEIVAVTGLTQSNTSNHLSCLRDCGLVVCSQHGRSVIYQLSDDRVGQLLALAENLLDDVAQGVACCTRYATEQETQ
jgi:ArsR family transcriptional regulator, cadmium/lead-responsive transcriptional repressor